MASRILETLLAAEAHCCAVQPERSNKQQERKRDEELRQSEEASEEGNADGIRHRIDIILQKETVSVAQNTRLSIGNFIQNCLHISDEARNLSLDTGKFSDVSCK